MCTVAQLIAKLQTIDQDAIVEVLQEHSHGYQTSTSFEPVSIEYIDVLDFTDDTYRETAPHVYGKVFVQLYAVE